MKLLSINYYVIMRERLLRMNFNSLSLSLSLSTPLLLSLLLAHIHKIDVTDYSLFVTNKETNNKVSCSLLCVYDLLSAHVKSFNNVCIVKWWKCDSLTILFTFYVFYCSVIAQSQLSRNFMKNFSMEWRMLPSD